MTTSYRVLCSVEMRHAYFADGQLRELAATPTPATAERLRRAGLLLKAQPSGFVVLSPGLPAAPPGLFPLLFSLRPRSPYFLNYSDLPLALGPGHTYCLGPPQAPDPRLQAGAVVGAADQLPLRPLAFWQPVAAGTATATLSRYPPGRYPPAHTLTLPVPPGATGLAFDLGKLKWGGSGRYQLRLGAAEPLVFYADDYLAATQPWGLLELDETVLTAPTPAPAYALSFAARATYWQYQVVARSLPLPAGLTIETHSPVSFKQVPAPAGVAASFLASEARLLAERYASPPYQLLLAGGGRPQVLYPALPPAGAETLRSKNNFAGALLVTDIFVQL